MQETALANDRLVLCGSYVLDWYDLFHASQFLIAIPLGEKVEDAVALNEPHLRGKRPSAATYFPNVACALVHDEDSWLGVLDDANVWTGISDIQSSPAALLDTLLNYSDHLSCTDARDRVYGFLGIVSTASTKEKLSLLADYVQTTVEEVFTMAMTTILEGSGLLTVLARYQKSSVPTLSNLPSWVGDFSQLKPYPFLTVQRNFSESESGEDDKEKWFDASLSTKLGFRIAGPQLHLHMFSYAVITHVAEKFDRSGINASLESLYGLVLHRHHEHAIPVDVCIDDIWRAMICDWKRVPASFDQAAVVEHDCRAWLSTWLLLCGVQQILTEQGAGATVHEVHQASVQMDALAAKDSSGLIPTSTRIVAEIPNHMILRDGRHYFYADSISELHDSSHTFGHAMREVTPGRRLVLLDDGNMALAHAQTEPGDHICIIADGGRTPMIMRGVPTGTDRCKQYTLVGEAYVSGIMYGEAINNIQISGRNWEEVCVI